MKFVEKFRLLREFNQARRQARRDHPEWDEEDCCAAAVDVMEAKYGASPDWQSILQMIIEFIMSILPFFFLAKEPSTTVE
ncbi:MAG: hypothetical protein GXY58_08215 [Planctomycetaceae bacterium]|nr:hypothetical protein [Planctomycetaceae bacterium]